MPAVMKSACGLLNIWLISCWFRSWSLETRDTTMPAAVEMISAGTCATRPSPMVSRV
jgi:hypothetical protein